MSTIGRREFLKMAGVGAVALAAPSWLRAAETGGGKRPAELARWLPKENRPDIGGAPGVGAEGGVRPQGGRGRNRK